MPGNFTPSTHRHWCEQPVARIAKNPDRQNRILAWLAGHSPATVAEVHRGAGVHAECWLQNQTGAVLRRLKAAGKVSEMAGGLFAATGAKA